MSTTTQILFNSPALHSLKRDQLVKLCKIHNIKANGKNVELIARLKQRAQEVAEEAEGGRKDEDEDDAIAQDDGPLSDFGTQMPRPSEQWEVVMEDIQEVEETGSSQSTMTSTKGSIRTVAGEFGTSGSKSE